MQTHRQHLFHEGGWWLDMVHSGFHCPKREVRGVSSLTYSNRAVLMPVDHPVCIRRLVKEQSTHGERVWIENGVNDRTYGIGSCNGSDFLEVGEQVASSVCCVRTLHNCREIVHSGVANQVCNNDETVASQLIKLDGGRDHCDGFLVMEAWRLRVRIASN